MSGILVLLNDCAPGKEELYEEWYQDEHLKERLGVNGFAVARRFEAIAAKRQYLTTYEVHSPDVLTSKEYLARLADPSPLTTQIMTAGIKNMCRTACRRETVEGSIRGTIAVVATLPDRSSLTTLKGIAGHYTISTRLCHIELWESAEPAGTISQTEENIRGPDEKIGACLALEFLRIQPALMAADSLKASLSSADVGVYQLMSYLRKDEVGITRNDGPLAGGSPYVS